MHTLKIQPLTLEAFVRYGTFADLIDPKGDITGTPGSVIEFYRDLAAITTQSDVIGISVTKVSRRPMVAMKAEYHDLCSEAIVPLNDDVVIHIAPASPHGVVPYEKFEAFLVPKNTLVVLRPGVWHHAPFALTQDSVSVLVLLPERTYARDCSVALFPEDQYMAIE